MQIKCLIVDDEPIARDVLRQHLEKVPNTMVAAECRNALEALDFLSDHAVDLMFLDIRMPRLSGIEMIKTLRHPPKIILVTAYRDYAVESFDLDVIDYLVKPVAFERFLKAMNRFFDSREPQGKPTVGKASPGNETAHIYVREHKRMIKIPLTDILYIESLRDYVRIHTSNKRVVTKMRIGALEEALPSDGFIRIHKSFIIGIRHILAVNTSHIEIPERTLPVGRTYRHVVRKVLDIKPVRL